MKISEIKEIHSDVLRDGRVFMNHDVFGSGKRWSY
jgi:hypothetical protein